MGILDLEAYAQTRKRRRWAGKEARGKRRVMKRSAGRVRLEVAEEVSRSEKKQLQHIAELFDAALTTFCPNRLVHLGIVFRRRRKAPMQVCLREGEYFYFKIELGQDALGCSEPALSIMVYHELIHIVLYPYTRLAEHLAKDDIGSELRNREEETVTILADICATLAGIQ